MITVVAGLCGAGKTTWILQELAQGAYGKVQRAKGIFELADGQASHFDFVSSLPGTAYTELPLPRWLESRPHRFSGLEVVGQGLPVSYSQSRCSI